MAISKKPLSFRHLAFTTILLMLTLLRRVNSLDSLSFNFRNFTEDAKDLIFQGDAHVTSNNVLQLTKTKNGVPQAITFGRALYSTQVHLWQKSTGREASFQSTFTFELTSPQSQPADGFTFFIAPPDTTIPAGTLGGYLALFNQTTALNPFANQVVAVEFDTFHTGDNTWDPAFRHIGIDVNTIRSSATVKWDRREGAIGTVRINYNAAFRPRTLHVVSSYPGSGDYTVSFVVDLKAILPEWVRIGFSAASGGSVQVHNIRSWSFGSTFPQTKAKKEEDIHIARVV